MSDREEPTSPDGDEPSQDSARSEASTRGVRVQVDSRYLPERSQPQNNVYYFVYHVQIENRGEETVQLRSRHWVITNAQGQVEEVRGPGVIGEQPVLATGESFEYTSFCPLTTAFGIMHGTYQMVTDTGEEFDAEVAPFQLGEPDVVH